MARMKRPRRLLSLHGEIFLTLNFFPSSSFSILKALGGENDDVVIVYVPVECVFCLGLLCYLGFRFFGLGYLCFRTVFLFFSLLVVLLIRRDTALGFLFGLRLGTTLLVLKWFFKNKNFFFFSLCFVIRSPSFS